MKRSYYDRELRKMEQHEDAKDSGLSCAHLESYRTEAAANRALERIRTFDGFASSKMFPKYAYQCGHVACLRWHLSAQDPWKKGMIESGLSEEEWYSKVFGAEMGWCDLG